MTDPTPSRPNLRFARGELVFGYRLVRKLGEGSFGSVWLAANDKGFEWALKIVNLGGSGGQKEFKALQLIKDRKINNTSLLKLIDYGLLDRDGTSLAAGAHKPTPKPAEPAQADPPAHGDESAAGPTASPQGTMMPLAEEAPRSRQTAVEKIAAWETQREPSNGDTTSDEQPRAAWLVIVMEVGQLTLHQLQLRATEKDFEDSPRKQTRAVTRMGMTAAGSKLKGTVKGTTTDPVEEPLVPLPVAQVLPYIEQAARGLDYLHRHDIVHRDIKPQNIILVGDDAKVCDYGLASESRNNSTATTIGCTPAYAAPEAINNRPVPASDQYSLAVTYIELITGRWPFFGVTQTAIYREKDEGKHNLTFIANPAARVVLKKALSKLPSDRYPTCLQFVEQIKLAENARPGMPRWLQVGVAAMLLVLVGAVVVGWAGPSIAKALANAVVSPVVPAENPEPQPDPNPNINPVLNDPPQPANTGTSASNLPDTPPHPPVPTAAELAEKNLRVAFNATGTSPADALEVFEDWILKSDKQEYWWGELEGRAAIPAWQMAVEKWLLANRVRKDDPAWLRERAYDSFEMEQKAASLQRLLHQLAPSPEALRQMLASDSFKLNDSHAIAKLVELDAQMRLNTKPVTNEDWVKWDGRIESALKQELAETEEHQRRQFVLYLRCQRLGPGNSPTELKAAGEDLLDLLDTEPYPAWLDQERKSRLAVPLGYVALNELGKTDRDLPAIDQFGLSKNKQLTNLLEIAAYHQLSGAGLDAARALLQANQLLGARTPVTSAAEWQPIEQLAWNGLNHAPTNDLLWNQQRRRLLGYVATYASLRTSQPGSEVFAAAVKTLATILLSKTKQGDHEQSLYFDFADEAQPHDAGVYLHLVQPALEHPGLKSEAVTTIDPGALATLWGVRGTLLRRSPSVAALVPPLTDTTLSPPTQKLLQQYRSFLKAQQFDALARAKTGAPANAEYLTGANRVLAGLPKQDESLELALSDLIALVREFDEVGASADPELLRLGAHVRMQQAAADRNPTSRKQLTLEAVRRYERLVSLNPPADNRHHVAVASERLSELHWNLAQQIELGIADYKFTADQTQPPPSGTKAFHLWQAKNYAEKASKIADRPHKDNAYLLLANAQEQMGQALGQLEQYDKAIENLKRGPRESTAAKRSTSRLQALLGRCELRQGQELFSGLTKDDRLTKLNAAVVSFTTSLGDRRQTGNYEPADAETLFAIAEAHLSLAQELPGEKAEQLESARVELERAATAGMGSPRIGQYRWRLLNLLAYQGQGTSSDPSRTGRDLADVILKDVLADPSNYEPAALYGIAYQAGWLHYEKRTSMLSWLPTSGPLAKHWQASDAARLEAIRLYCEAAVASVYDQKILAQARQLERTIERGSVAQRTAEALIQDVNARSRCFSYENYKPAAATGGATESKQQDSRGVEQAQAKLAIDSIQDCHSKYLDSLDSHVRPFADRLHAVSLDDIYANKFQPKLTVLEKRALWKYATTAPPPDTRKKFIEICRAAQGTGSTDPAAPRTESSKLAQELLKPIVFFKDLKDRDPRFGALLDLYKPPKAEPEKTKAK